MSDQDKRASEDAVRRGFDETKDCDKCGGTGKVANRKCLACGGHGWLPVAKDIEPGSGPG